VFRTAWTSDTMESLRRWSCTRAVSTKVCFKIVAEGDLCEMKGDETASCV
jgi:hypothetical protein